jgi:hypothetical protein
MVPKRCQNGAMPVTPAEHAATANIALVRGAFPAKHNVHPNGEHWALCRRCSLDSAMDEIVALAERATELERERDETSHYLTHCRGLLDDVHGRAERLERALREIAEYDVDEAGPAARIARAALGETA